MGGAATLAVVFVPELRFAYRKPTLHVALEVAAALIALLAAYLVFGRFRRSSRVDDLLIVCGLALLSVSNFVFAGIPAAAALRPYEGFWTWAALVGQLIAAIVLSVSAFAPARRLARPRRTAARLLLACAGVLCAIGVAMAVAASELPRGVSPEGSPEGIARPHLDAHPALLAVQLVSVVLFTAAAFGFLRRAELTGDDLMRWFAVGAVLAAFARLNYFLYPSRFSEWVYVGDAFRFLFYCALVLGAAVEIQRYWRAFAEAAVLEERRRLARDLHDGLAQELAFIARTARRTASAGQTSREIIASAERGLDEARRAISALTRPLDEPFDVALAQAVEEVAARTGARVVLDLAPDTRLLPEEAETLIRIAREAVSNAAQHAQASVIRVELANEERARLRIIDDGIGFTPDAVSTDTTAGHGLTSMRERASAVGANFRVRSRPGAGSEVEVELR